MWLATLRSLLKDIVFIKRVLACQNLIQQDIKHGHICSLVNLIRATRVRDLAFQSLFKWVYEVTIAFCVAGACRLILVLARDVILVKELVRMNRLDQVLDRGVKHKLLNHLI